MKREERYYTQGEIQEELNGRFKLPRGCRFMTFCPYGRRAIQRVVDGIGNISLDQYEAMCTMFIEFSNSKCSRYKMHQELLSRRTKS